MARHSERVCRRIRARISHLQAMFDARHDHVSRRRTPKPLPTRAWRRPPSWVSSRVDDRASHRDVAVISPRGHRHDDCGAIGHTHHPNPVFLALISDACIKEVAPGVARCECYGRWRYAGSIWRVIVVEVRHQRESSRVFSRCSAGLTIGTHLNESKECDNGVADA